MAHTELSVSGPVSIYQLLPPEGAATLSFHFGRQGIGLEEAAESLPSDSLFAALVTQAALLEGGDPEAAYAPAFLRPFLAGAPPFLVSSLAPRLGDLPLLPRPMLPLAGMDEAQRERIGKGFKTLRYLSPALFAAIAAGRSLPPEPLIMQDGRVWLHPAEAANLPEPWRRGSRESEAAWRRRLGATPIWRLEEIPRVTVDRAGSASAYYEVGRVTFAPGAGLALLARFADPAARGLFERLLDLLAASGLGGRRSSGYGAFRWEARGDLALDLGPPGSRAVLLSRYLPRDDELETLRGERAAYNLIRVGGWFYSPGWPARRRQQVLMVAEGSVLDLRGGPARGRLVDARPAEARVQGQPPHPVYRSGLALGVLIPDPEEAL